MGYIGTKNDASLEFWMICSNDFLKLLHYESIREVH